MSKSNALSVTNYTDGVATEAYTFEHDATEQTPALTDYRYIGASPNNYVYFNCDDNGENCEIWRAIGVFYVDDGDDNWEWRVKLVRGSAFAELDYWNTELANDWTTASIKNTLNGTYFSSLSETAQLQIEDAMYYLGATDLNGAEVNYSKERGNILCKSCDSDYSKLSWKGKIGLMYSSDVYMVYKGIDECYANSNSCANMPYASIYNHPET